MPLFEIETVVLLNAGLRCSVIVIGGTFQIPMNLVDPGSIIDRYELGHSFLSERSKGDFGLSGKLIMKMTCAFAIKLALAIAYFFIDLNASEQRK